MAQRHSPNDTIIELRHGLNIANTIKDSGCWSSLPLYGPAVLKVQNGSRSMLQNYQQASFLTNINLFFFYR